MKTYKLALLACAISLAQPAFAADVKPTAKPGSTGSTGEAKPAPSQPKMLYEKEAAKNPAICPVCGRPWSEHTENNPCVERMQSRKEVISCPSCDLEFYTVNRKAFRSNMLDRDLCPQPPDSAKKLTPLVICPRCGFSAIKESYEKKLPPDLRAWVAANLTKPTQAEMMAMLEANLNLNNSVFKVEPEKVYTYFSEKYQGRELPCEDQMPDIMRTGNALAFAKHINTEPDCLGQFAWYCAWSWRRAVCAPISSACLIDSVKKVSADLSKESDQELSSRDIVKKLLALYEDKAKFGTVDQCIILFMLAVEYQRQGETEWARGTFKECLRIVKNDALWKTGNDQDKEQAATAKAAIDMQRKTLQAHVSARMVAIENEEKMLIEGTAQVVLALEFPYYSIKEMPALVYLVGEEERRSRHYGRAHAWLSMAAKLQMPDKLAGAEIWAGEQLDTLENSLRQRGEKDIPPNPQEAQDKRLFEKIEVAVKMIRDEYAKEASGDQGATGSKPADPAKPEAAPAKPAAK